MATSYQPASKTRLHHARQQFNADHIPVVAATGGGDCDGHGDGGCDDDSTRRRRRRRRRRRTRRRWRGRQRRGLRRGRRRRRGWRRHRGLPFLPTGLQDAAPPCSAAIQRGPYPSGGGGAVAAPCGGDHWGRLRRFDALVRYIRALLVRQQGFAKGLRASRGNQLIFHNILYNKQLRTLSQRNRRNHRPLTAHWHDNCIILADSNIQEGFIAMRAAITKREPIDPLSSQCPKLRKGV